MLIIGAERMERPAPMGRASTTAMRMESSAMRAASWRRPRAIAAEIAGTTEMVSGVMKLAGRLYSVWALP